MTNHILHDRAADGCRVSVIRYDCGLHQPVHAHEFTSLSLVLRGLVREDVGPTTVRAGVLDLVVKPAGTPHENLFLADGTTLIQVIASEEVLRRSRDAGCPVDSWQWFAGASGAARSFGALAGMLARPRGAPDASEAPDASDAATGNDDLEAAVEDAIASLDSSGRVGGQRAESTGPPQAWIRRAREAIDEAVASGASVPSVGQLAQDAGVHRVHFSREFRRYVGVSPTEYRQRARLRAAAESVGSSVASLSGAAYRAGFADQAHMTREFRRRLGVTPREFRDVVSLPISQAKPTLGR